MSRRLGHHRVALFGRIRRCDFTRGSLSLGVRLRLQKPRPGQRLFLLPVDLDEELSAARLAPCLSVCMFPAITIMD